MASFEQKCKLYRKKWRLLKSKHRYLSSKSKRNVSGNVCKARVEKIIDEDSESDAHVMEEDENWSEVEDENDLDYEMEDGENG